MEEIISLFERLGIPAGFLVLMYILYVKTQTWNQKQQMITQQKYVELAKQSQDRYEDLTNKFIDTTNKIVVENTKCLTNLIQKIDAHTKTKEEFITLIKEKDDRLHGLYEIFKDVMKNNRK